MVLNSLIFALIAYGIAMVIALCVALTIKLIAIVVRRGDKLAAASSALPES
ncbi:MAG: hypothetical protein QGI95_02260 [Dehalococcoidales bacterium]|jgi:ABC-type nitrate/sulfonate/bicarbonate transport system permease component|nr:hypothetical protein [Dehalococcoidales bacterium]MDP6824936.1 hypothetical protein [Dehalococcoidales bacterium]|tara:strand:+ start:113 stop:265 length:153 start_codon:yes stop_codon:yes gene_type:complete